MSDASTMNPPEAAEPPSTGREIELEHPKDHFGNVPDWDMERYDEEAPARKGRTTRPSGQGGATPHDGVSYQDYFPPNPPPSESAAAKGEENDAIARGETDEVTLANERLEEITQTAVEDQTADQQQAEAQAQDQTTYDPTTGEPTVEEPSY